MQKNTKKLPLSYVVFEVFSYIKNKADAIAIASIVNFAFLGIFSLFVKTTSSGLFLPWICVYYAFWFAFFRFYYDKKPLLFTKQIFGTVAPSAKILFIVFSLTLLVILMPFLPLFVGYNEEYAFFIDKYMSNIQTLSQSSDGVSQNILPLVVLHSILFLLSPIIFIRPMFAWISSLIGRSGSIRNAFNNTHGNYFNFLLLSLIFEMPLSVFEISQEIYRLNEMIIWLFVSPIIVLGNIAIAKSYDFFFLKSDDI